MTYVPSCLDTSLVCKRFIGLSITLLCLQVKLPFAFQFNICGKYKYYFKPYKDGVHSCFQVIDSNCTTLTTSFKEYQDVSPP